MDSQIQNSPWLGILTTLSSWRVGTVCGPQRHQVQQYHVGFKFQCQARRFRSGQVCGPWAGLTNNRLGWHHGLPLPRMCDHRQGQQGIRFVQLWRCRPWDHMWKKASWAKDRTKQDKVSRMGVEPVWKRPTPWSSRQGVVYGIRPEANGVLDDSWAMVLSRW